MPELPDQDKQRAREISKSPHLCCMFMTLTIIVLGVWFGLCNFTNNRSESQCRDANGFLPYALAAAYIAYWIECCCSGSQKYLMNDMETLQYEGYMQQIKSSAPLIGTRIECYHYEIRTRTVYYTDSNGNSRSRTETYTERVTTYTGTSYWDYKSWEDTTGEIVGVLGGELVKLEVVKSYEFGNYESARRFEEHRSDYISSNRYRDDHMDDYPVFEIPGHKQKVLVSNKGVHKPCCMDVGIFWMFSLILLSWPYRMWFEFLTERKKISLRKVVYA